MDLAEHDRLDSGSELLGKYFWKTYFWIKEWIGMRRNSWAEEWFRFEEYPGCHVSFRDLHGQMHQGERRRQSLQTIIDSANDRSSPPPGCLVNCRSSPPVGCLVHCRSSPPPGCLVNFRSSPPPGCLVNCRSSPPPGCLETVGSHHHQGV